MSTLVQSSNLANTIYIKTLQVSSISANGVFGTTEQILTANSTGGVYWSIKPTVAGSNTEVQFNDNGVISSNSSFTFNKTTATLSSNNITVTNNITVANNIGVNAITANGSIGTVGQVLVSDGAKTYWSTPTTGTITNIVTGTGLTGGPITGTGTITLADTAVIPGVRGSANTVATFTVDQQGRLIAASNTLIAIDWIQVTSGKPTTLAGYGITDAIPGTRSITGTVSLTGGGDFTANRTIALVGDSAAPGNNFYYGTNATGVKGYYSLPSLPVTSVDNTIARFNGTAGAIQTSAVVIDDTNNITGVNDLTVNGNTVFGNASADQVTINGLNVLIPNNLNIDNNTLFINSTSNRIGIGTNTPLTALDVTGSISQNIIASTGVIDLSLGNYFRVTGATAISFTNIQATRASDVYLEIINGGASSLTWPTMTWMWEQNLRAPGKVPLLKASGTDLIRIKVVGSNIYGYSNIPSGGSVTQLTSKSTPVTLNAITGQITTANSLLALDNNSTTTTNEVTFRLNNTFIGADDVVIVQSKNIAGKYSIQPTFITNGACDITISNLTTANQSEAIIIQFIVIKGSSLI